MMFSLFLVCLQIFCFLCFSCNGSQDAVTQNLRVCVDSSDFGETVAWPLTDIWKSTHSESSPESKARGQTDKSRPPLQRLPSSMMDSRFGTQGIAANLKLWKLWMRADCCDLSPSWSEAITWKGTEIQQMPGLQILKDVLLHRRLLPTSEAVLLLALTGNSMGVTQLRAWNKMLIREAWLTHTTSYQVNQRRLRSFSPPKISFPEGLPGKKNSCQISTCEKWWCWGFPLGLRPGGQIMLKAGGFWVFDTLVRDRRLSIDSHSGQRGRSNKFVSETGSP